MQSQGQWTMKSCGVGSKSGLHTIRERPMVVTSWNARGLFVRNAALRKKSSKNLSAAALFNGFDGSGSSWDIA
eukprot:10868228-Karenia_brevis.AAC.1